MAWLSVLFLWCFRILHCSASRVILVRSGFANAFVYCLLPRGRHITHYLLFSFLYCDFILLLRGLQYHDLLFHHLLCCRLLNPFLPYNSLNLGLFGWLGRLIVDPGTLLLLSL